MKRLQACRKLAGVLFSLKAENVGALLPDTRCQLAEITIGWHQVEASEPLRSQKVHGVDNQRNIASVLANRVQKISMWQAFIERRDFGPAVEPRAGEIALKLLRAGAIDFCDLIEQHGSVLRGRVVSADQHRKLGRAVGSSVMLDIVSANFVLVFAGLPGVPTGDPRDVEN
jgi:hypothetical protein